MTQRVWVVAECLVAVATWIAVCAAAEKPNGGASSGGGASGGRSASSGPSSRASSGTSSARKSTGGGGGTVGVSTTPNPTPKNIADQEVVRAANLLGMPEKAVAAKGSLVIAGGGRIPEEVYQEFLKLAGGERAKLVIIPSAHKFPNRAQMIYRYSGWREYKTAGVEYLDAATREQADTEKFVEPLRDATGVWFTGGYQGRLSQLYGNTKVEAAIKAVIERGGVIGGTSAGAAILSETMIRYGRTVASLDRGLGLVQKSIIDMHFTQRNREGRLLGALEEHPQQVGVGIDEGTALVVQGDRLRVLGNSHVMIYLPKSKRDKPARYTLKPGDDAELTVATAADAPNGGPSYMLRRLMP